VIALRGRDACPPAARDHKRLGDGDAGRNTGGMGPYSPLADVPEDTSPIAPGFPSAGPRERLDAGWFFAAPVRRLILTPDRGRSSWSTKPGSATDTQASLPRLPARWRRSCWSAAAGRLRDAAAAWG